MTFACDFRVALPLSRISFPEIDRGMHLSWGIIPRLVSECGASLTRRLALLGDPVAVEEFPNEVFVVHPDGSKCATELASQLAAKPMRAIRSIKAAIAEQTAATAVDQAADVARFTASLKSPEFMDAISAYLHKSSTSSS